MILTVPAALAALLAGLAAALFVLSPAGQLSRAAPPDPNVGRGRLTWLRPWLSARPDAPPLRQRVVVALAGGVAVGVALQTLGSGIALVGWALAPLLVPVIVVVLGRLEPTRARRRREQLTRDLPQALELIAAGLAAGLPLRSASAAVARAFDGPVAEDLAQVLALVDLGVSDGEAWATLNDNPAWRPCVVDLARSLESGTRVVEALKQHALDARSRRRAAIEIRAKAVAVRSVLPLMVCFLPAFLLVGVIPTVASALLHALP